MTTIRSVIDKSLTSLGCRGDAIPKFDPKGSNEIAEC